MTLQQAINKLQLRASITIHGADATYIQALTLGIEALKRIKQCGYPARCGLMERLPGQTEDQHEH